MIAQSIARRTENENAGKSDGQSQNQGKEQIDTQSESEANIQRLRMKVYVSVVIIICANLFGFWGAYKAYESTKIDAETFSFLKNLLSINLIACGGWLFYRAFRRGIFSLSDLD